MDDEKLIKAVRCFPCLWQVNSKLYRDVIAKGNNLKEIANQVSELPAIYLCIIIIARRRKHARCCYFYGTSVWE